MKFRMHWAAAAAAAGLVAACGGGGADTTPAAPVTSVKVVGDSLADSGTFGLKFTVQGTAPTGAGSTPIWPERVATSYGQSLCPHYDLTSGTLATRANCTNYAVGKGAINFTENPNGPQSILRQLADAGAAGYGPGDLLLVDGGGNDAADLISAYLAAPRDGGASYAALLSSVLDAATVKQLLAAGPTGMAQAGGAYMQALAVRFATTIKTQALAKGAPRVAILNMPPVTLTPKFRTVLGAVAQANGAAAAAQAEGLFDGWVRAFNAKLNEQFAGDARVVIADFYGSFRDQINDPAQFAYTNVTTPVCPVTGVDAKGLPTYTFATCTAAALSAHPPAGASGPDWWQHYSFSDGFHPTPYTHQLMGQLVSRSLSQAGWL
ncbi:Phospholipase/lecithinase/hemolysin [Oryzisolibacter propanilivorax]|uniref:Phospholipase/lecithinase/hemolysin n=1 Tax=Oryzisolibacter propanilivorax TaxID=1527607 RepID=A0A1G9Q5Q7_9BURK|nr:SGNH/GDSL hydrolase family protein [Oryzisolibacter propanilivorax]SDM06299.1 Phospholipase/lecithinase/hemolysin [Oryzisolibacter propanilivorax]